MSHWQSLSPCKAILFRSRDKDWILVFTSHTHKKRFESSLLLSHIWGLKCRAETVRKWGTFCARFLSFWPSGPLWTILIRGAGSLLILTLSLPDPRPRRGPVSDHAPHVRSWAQGGNVDKATIPPPLLLCISCLLKTWAWSRIPVYSLPWVHGERNGSHTQLWLPKPVLVSTWILSKVSSSVKKKKKSIPCGCSYNCSW